MSAIKKISIIRHNLLGASDNNREGSIVNEIFYDEDGHEIERLNYSSEGELEERIIVEINNGKSVEERLELGGELSERTSRTFDEKGRVLTETRHYAEGGNDITSYHYDGDNLVSRLVIDSDGDEGEKESWEYNENNQLIHEVQIDMFGEPESEKVYEYNENGLLAEITETSYQGDMPEITVSLFDERGRLITEKRYDSKERLVARTNIEYHENGKPLKIEEESVRGKKITNLEYDDAGNNTIQEETDGNGQRTSYVERTYNESGHLLTSEVLMEHTSNQNGQHYMLEYSYELAQSKSSGS